MLPAYPWQSRPDNHPLTADEVCEALVHSGGDITQAAERLRVGSLILRKFIERSSRARAVAREMDHRLGDRARSRLIEALNSDDDRRCDWAIRFVLNSLMARHLRLSASDPAAPSAAQLQGPQVNINLAPANWLDGQTITLTPTPAPQIELASAALPDD